MFYSNYIRLCNEKNMSPSAVAEAIGGKRSSVTRWKNGSMPSDATLQKLADFFHCPVGELTGEPIYNDTPRSKLPVRGYLPKKQQKGSPTTHEMSSEADVQAFIDSIDDPKVLMFMQEQIAKKFRAMYEKG